MRSVSGHIPEEEVRKFRELKEKLWEIQQFGPGPFEEAEALPLICPDFEMSYDQVKFTEALDLPFKTFLYRAESALNLNGVHGQILRAVLVRVKSRKSIKKHKDVTFPDADCQVWRMQVYKSNDEDFLQVDDEKFSPMPGILYEIPRGAVVSEENTGLNDNIHLLLYLKSQSASEILAAANL